MREMKSHGRQNQNARAPKLSTVKPNLAGALWLVGGVSTADDDYLWRRTFAENEVGAQTEARVAESQQTKMGKSRPYSHIRSTSKSDPALASN
jgi:hypothetical protein